MLHRTLKSMVAIMLMVSVVFCTCSCIQCSGTDIEEKQWYGCRSFRIPATKGYSQNVYAYFYSEGYYYITIYGQIIDESIEGCEDYYRLYKIDSKGNNISYISLPVQCASMSHQVIQDNKLFCVDMNSNTEYVIDANNGEMISKKRTNDSVHGYYSTNDGYIRFADSELIQYSKEGNEKCRLKLQDIDNVLSIYQMEYKTYLIENKNNLLVFYVINFDKGLLEKVVELNIKDCYGFSLDNGVFFSNDGVYCVDVLSKSLVSMAEWNCVDVSPAYKKTYYEANISYGNGKFGMLYAYNDYEIELIIFYNLPSEIYSGRKPIIIGGYGVNNSLAIRWAVYEFNTSQSEYRVYLEDYWNEYSYSSGVEAQSQIAKLIKHFNDGYAPDIYYGTNFDYRYMYNIGLVTDLLPFMENDPDFDLNDLIPSVKDTISKNGVCYQMFSAYYFDGDFGLKSIFSDEEITYTQIDSIAQAKGVPVRGDMPASEFADQIIRYSLGDLVDRATESHILSVEELRDVIEYSIRNGIPQGANSNSIADMDSVHYGTYLTCRRTWLGNLYDVSEIEGNLNDSFIYLGFPSVYGSAHAAQPDGLVAISSDSKNQDACWQLIKCMLMDRVQEIEIGQGNNPVIKDVFIDYCKYAEDPELVPETEFIWKSIVYDRDPVPKWIIMDYQSMVNSIDCVISYDWGLYNIISDEINSYYSQHKNIDDISISLQSRLDLYVSENYN